MDTFVSRLGLVGRAFLPTAILLFLIGCVAMPVRDATIHDGQQGSVYLERVPGAGFQAGHPATIEPALMSRILRGVQVQPRETMMTTFVFGETATERAFSDADVEFLTPLIVRALSKATPQQTVGFTVIQPSLVGPVTTGGTLFARRETLHLTLTQYRYRPDSRTTVYARGRTVPDSTGLDQRKVLFAPAVVLDPDPVPEPALSSLQGLSSLPIDYHLLSKMPETEQAVGPAAPPGPPRPAATGLPDEKDKEIGVLKEELRLLQQKIEEQDAQLKKLTPKAKEKPNDRP